VSLTDMPTHRLIPTVARPGLLSDGKLAPEPVWRDIRPTRAEIDLDALAWNAGRIKAKIGNAALVAVVKADAYGHGAVVVAQALQKLSAVAGCAASLTEEAFELRGAGVAGPILVMGGIYGDQHAEVVALDLTPVVFDLRDVEAFARAGRPVGVHVKLDTGMS